MLKKERTLNVKIKNTKEEKAITLIALVITIIVLLILAGVTISALSGDNGILTKAAQAKKASEMAEIKERAELIKQNMIIESKKEGTELKQKDLVEEINKDFEGVKEGNASIVYNGKYIIKVDNKLNITVEEYTGKYVEEGELGIILSYSPTDEGVEGVKINVQVKIGGIPTYEEYAQEILESKTQEEKEQYFIEYYRANMERLYPGVEVNIENILKYMLYDMYSSLEDYYKRTGYNTLEEFLIGRKMVETQEYSNMKISVTLPSGGTASLSMLYPTTTFTVYNNGTYTVKGTYEGKTAEESVEITNIKDKIIYDLPKEDENTYTIGCIEDLVGLSINVNNCIDNYSGKTIKMERDLDFSDDSSYKNPNDTSLGDINHNGKIEPIKVEVTTGEGFEPIGRGNEYDNSTQITYSRYFYGTFEGNNKTINNLYIQKTDMNLERAAYIGLFGNITYGTVVKNLTVTGNIDIKVTNKMYSVYIGSIAGYIQGSGKIEGCNNYVNIKASMNVSTYTGGIIGNNGYSGTVNSCNNYGNIEVNYGEYLDEGQYINDIYTGGIVGNNSGLITTCNNYNDIKISSTENANASRPYVGGICGYNSKTIEKCSNIGNITNTGIGVYIYVAGISGMNYAADSINQCFNTGTILNEGDIISSSGSCQAAGIVASNSGSNTVGSIVENCYNVGTIINNAKNRRYIGGVVSYNSAKSKVVNSYNIGNYSNKEELEHLGAIVANPVGKTIQNCYYLQGVYTQGTDTGEIGTTSKTDTEMKTQEFITLLQGNETETIWKIDSKINNGYPIFVWQQ